jgi:FtsP/CotA-like multicopper oxidase with cupredoxin domain
MNKASLARYDHAMPRFRTPLNARALAVLAVVAAVLGVSLHTSSAGATTLRPCAACKGYATGQPLRDLPALMSANDVLSTTLTARLSTVAIGGRRVKAEVYNGAEVGPTLVVDPGDRLNVLLRNRMDADYLPYGASSHNPPPLFPGQPYVGWPQRLGNITNLHVHGLHVSPNPPSDDVLLQVRPGHDFQYRYDLPEDISPGVYWYHPHGHHYTDMQLSQGQAGAIIVRGGLDNVPGIAGLRDRLMVIQNPTIARGQVTSGQYLTPVHRLITINAQVQPVIDIKPGETQRWRLVNASSERFLSLVAPKGGVQFWEIARDGSRFETPVRNGVLFLSPGQRVELLVRAGPTPGSFPIVQRRFDQRPTPYGQQPRVQIATMRVAGEAQTPAPIPMNLGGPTRDMSGPGVRIAARHVIRFSQSPPHFFIDGAMFWDTVHAMPGMSGMSMGSMGPTFVARVNTVQEWTLANDSPEWHNFHIHVNDFQVVRRNGVAVGGQPQWYDTVAIPPGRTVVIRIPFDDFTGTFVFHCHVLVHEDHGMMAIVKVVDRGRPPLTVPETAS